MVYQWDQSLAVGVPIIDQQHKEFFKRINDLLEAMKMAKGRQEVFNTLAFLGHYIKTHFRAEELLQEKFEYPELEAHCAIHQAFEADFEKFKREVVKSGVTMALTIEVQRWGNDWLVNHIANVDKRFGAFIKTRIKPELDLA